MDLRLRLNIWKPRKRASGNYDTIIYWLINQIIGVLRVCATKNEETLSYRKGSGNVNFDNFDNTSVYLYIAM